MSGEEFVIGPHYAPAPEWAARPDAPKGTLHKFTLESADSAIYPGIRRLENEVTRRRDAYGNRIAAAEAEQSEPAPYTRTVGVYVPAQVAPGARFIVVQDGSGFAKTMPALLDNLIAAKRIPALVAVFVNSGGGDAQGSQRGLEYDTLSGRYSDFIESEVLAKIAGELGIVLARDPQARATMGASSGAACAFTMAWFHPERYARVLSYSGTFVNQQSPPNAQSPRGAWEYHDHLIADAQRKPLRVWLEVGEKDLHCDDPQETWHNWPLANARMAAALKAKGYAYRYVFAREAAHVDARVIEQTLPGALEWLWRDA